MKVFHNKGQLLFTMLLLLFVLAVVFGSLSYGEEAMLIPFIVGIPTVILLTLVLITENYSSLFSRFRVSADSGIAGSMAKDRQKDVGEREPARSILAACVWMGGFFGLVFVGGFLVGIPVFVLLYFKFSARMSWLVGTLATVATAGFIYGVFEIAMKVDLFKGIAFGSIVPPL